MKYLFSVLALLGCLNTLVAQEEPSREGETYKRRVLENTEVDLLMGYYSQDGKNAAVTGGRGTEELTDIAPNIVVSIPLNADDILTIDAGISAYTSASSSNVNPFDGKNEADPFVASSGASASDVWANFTGTYSHSSDDRNDIWTAKISVSTEYDYFSVGAGGSYTKLFNEKNTELGINVNVFLDTWNALYPYELRPFLEGGNGANNDLFNRIEGGASYNPAFTEFDSETRNSYSAGLTLSQILSKNVQASLAVDLVQQKGLLSTPFQRVYFEDFNDVFIENFHLADDVERLPDSRFKIAVGSRFNIFLNETFVLRSYYRFYIDDWGIRSNTASIEVPVKVSQKITLYPSYRYYDQTEADYFAPYNEHVSTEEFYTSDYDLSDFNANQYGMGVKYTDIFTKLHVWHLGLKSVDLRYLHYQRNSGLNSDLISGGFSFIME